MNTKARLERLEKAHRPPTTWEVWTQEDYGETGYLICKATGERVKDGELPPEGPSVQRIVIRYTHDWRGTDANTERVQIAWPEELGLSEPAADAVE